ncbi:MAG: response regulator [Bacteroidota bacterium]
MSTTKPTCIILEDESDMRDLLKSQLQRIDLVDVIDDYDDTIKGTLAVEKKKPDVLLLDVNIKGLEGPYFVEALNYRPKIIVISGYTEDVMNNFDLKYDLFLRKPVTTERLKTALEKVLA